MTPSDLALVADIPDERPVHRLATFVATAKSSDTSVSSAELDDTDDLASPARI